MTPRKGSLTCGASSGNPERSFLGFQDYSPEIRGYTETIRLWRLCRAHDDVDSAVKGVERALHLGRECTVTLRAKLAASSTDSCIVNGLRVPRRFTSREVEGVMEDDFDDPGLDASPFPDGRGVVYYPPALVTSEYSRNVLKFYKLNDTVLDTVLLPTPQPQNPKPQTSNPEPQTLNLKP